MASPQVDVPQAHRGPAERGVEGLARVRLPAEPRVVDLEVLPHGVHGAPERRGRELDHGLPHGRGDLAVVARAAPFERVPRIAAVSRFWRNSLMSPSLYMYRLRALTPSSSYA